MSDRDIKPSETIVAESLVEDSPTSIIEDDESGPFKPISQEYTDQLYELDCEYAAYKLALSDPDSPESKHKRKLDKMLSALGDQSS